MISVEPHSWYIVILDGGWVFSQPYGLLGDCKIALGAGTLTRWGMEFTDGNQAMVLFISELVRELKTILCEIWIIRLNKKIGCRSDTKV